MSLFAATAAYTEAATLVDAGHARTSPACFASRQWTAPQHHTQVVETSPQRLRLDTRQSEMLAALLPVLLCGEESASLAFARISTAPALSQTGYQQARRIESDERMHEHWLAQIKQSLPAPVEDPTLLRAAKRFFCGLAERDLGRHFARIAALDSAVCILLGALRRRRGCIEQEPTLNKIFARIHGDEARHVLIARDFTLTMLGPSQARELTIDTRHELVKLLAIRASVLETLLHIDPDKLFSKLRKPARELLA